MGTVALRVDALPDSTHTEARLRQIEEDFAHAARLCMLGEMVSSIVHEVRQPLSAIVMDTDTSLRLLSQDTPDLKKLRFNMARMKDCARRASELVHRIKQMAAKRDPICTSVDINGVISDSIELMAIETVSRSIRIHCSLDPAIPLVLGDALQLQQVIVNLLINAVQAIELTSSGRREICVKSKQSFHGVRISIEDDGAGIPEPLLGQIFDAYFSTKRTGMGMGLSISRSIVEAHGGTIRATNGPRGAILDVDLPREGAPWADISDEAGDADASVVSILGYSPDFARPKF
ncbi:sensor histidine kinase [Sinorhizobium mexicanum]|uniref:histidine kinase n=1 Tax=Sinorhizobium mexicanum TaxID=375549 RepID=A0A859R7A4_9HYPH|nr:ATP-binding protein [Sinorhizobium mexicanum]MBP1884423.1 C4-dicarboxylate-specific signal transduction histidine kinase [Sinorhizobium mexicanum]QLL65358.1 GHKL domain-containing protein [Sinorhizobium mexicanum]